ncbi:hypothetical protein BKA70DRAFT_1219443 [Coprinopsis sp. MPI-PUGE-AT-0042]|nr:hypothetical protein BKA70DRAFT_1219443 [Coprinopsis sp. MPI-PUGE-AT-0042]
MPRSPILSGYHNKPDFEHYIRRIQAAQVHTAYSPPEILHWDETKRDLGAWGWPANPETGERVTPSDLESHRRTHHFMAPCCLCAIRLAEAYVEAKIGLVAVASDSPKPEVNGEYVAQCASNRCGYFVPLERFYARKVLKIKAYAKRVVPLAAEQLVYISDFDCDTEASLGLSQALPSQGIWMTGSRNSLIVETPTDISNACTDFTALWARGLHEDAFWRLMVMPKDVFFGTHGVTGCRTQREIGGWPTYNQFDQLDEISISGDTEIIDWNTDEDTDDEMPPLEPIED